MLTSCSRSAEVRYKVSVELEEDGQTRSGSSIWSWRITKPTVALASPYNSEFHGEAVAVALAHHPTVFGLLVNSEADSHYAPLLVERLFGRGSQEARRSGRPYDRVEDVRDIASRVGERVVVDCRDLKACPMLVWFERADDPTSIQMADPAQFPNLDKGITLRSITIEITEDSSSQSISQTLPWLVSVGSNRPTLIPRPKVRPGQGVKKPNWTPIESVGTRAFSTELFNDRTH